jgi:protein-tyrosine phosphatase
MVTDFHSHVLPGIDDGSTSVEESIAMLRMAAEQGVRRVIATPHFYPRHDSPEHFLEKRNLAESALREAMSRETDLPELSIGAEVHFFSGISNSDILHQLTIDGKCCILIEMPPAPWSDSMYRELEQIWRQWGIRPIIAHVDRYIGRFRTHGIPERLAQLPVAVQANAGFFLQGSASMAMRMLKKGQIHLLGSDCHNLSSRRPNLGAAAEKIRSRLGQEALDRIAFLERDILSK